MIDIVKRDVIAVLSELASILKTKDDADFVEIKELSNHIIHNASVFQDEDSISVAVLIYSLSKILDRNHDLDYGKILAMVNSALANLKNGNEDSYRKSIMNIFNFIKTIDKKIGLYVNEVINQAQIKKGCKLCEHGVSVARASEVMGISQWELMHYLGKTNVADRYDKPVNAAKRLKIARGIFS